MHNNLGVVPMGRFTIIFCIAIAIIRSSVHADIITWDVAQIADDVTGSSAGQQIQGERVVYNGNNASGDLNQDIYVYDHTTGATTNLTSSLDNETRPRIDGDHVTWNNANRGVHNLATGTFTAIPNAGNEMQVAGGHVFWQKKTSANFGTFHNTMAYRISDGTTFQMSSSDTTFRNNIDSTANYVTWQRQGGFFGGGEKGTIVYDIATGTRQNISTLTSTNADATFEVQVDGEYAAWTIINSSLRDVHLFHIPTGQHTQVTNDSAARQELVLADGQMAWSAFDGNDYEIFRYDIATGTTIQITDNAYDDFSLSLSEGNLAWIGKLSSSQLSTDVFTYLDQQAEIYRLTNDFVNSEGVQISGRNVTWSNRVGSFSGDSNDVFFATAVPEPTAVLFGVICTVGFFLTRRRLSES